MVKKELVKGAMLTALAALGISLNLCSGEFAYAADNQAVALVVGSSEEALRVMHDTYSQEEESGDNELSMEQYISSLITTVDAGGWRIEDGVPYWYENGVKQGTEGRGKEIYDPGSAAWYWLDAVDGGRMAVSKDVYQESKADNAGNIGKWVRYDENGHMIKGWDTNENGRYYFDPVYGTMAKGDADIDGVHYYFNKDTGILERSGQTDDDGNSFLTDGWHKVDGVNYWYENGVRQGVKYNADGSIDTSYRGKEIYDPASEAWYWLDCVLGGAKAASKDVYQESKADDAGNIGKWVRYDADGHMVKGWQTTEAGTYFFDYTYGTMMKGEVIMDGFRYTFDKATGILVSKEATTTTEAPHSHNYTSTVTKASTCTEDGIMTFICSCGDTYTEAIGKIAHSYGEYTYNNDATTENDGTKTATCAICGTSDTIVAEGTKVVDTTHTHDYQVNDRGFTVCTICGEYPPLPTESCPYPVNTIIDNGDGTYCMYYVNSGRTENKFGISDGCVGNNAGNDFQTFCDKNYLDVAFDCYIGDYAEGCISWICGQPRSF